MACGDCIVCLLTIEKCSGEVRGSDKGRRLPDECQECNLRILECARRVARCISAHIDSDKDRAF